MCEFSKYPANPIALGGFGKNCADGLGRLLIPNSCWIWDWSFDRSGSWATISAKVVKIYSGGQEDSEA
jgi:hypothetical protein